MNKKNNPLELKEKLKQALISTIKVISDDLKIEKNTSLNKSPEQPDFFELESLKRGPLS